MNPVRRAALIEAAAVARKRHAPVAHIDHELQRVTVLQLQAETRAFWPLPIISVAAALAAGSIAILFFAGVI